MSDFSVDRIDAGETVDGASRAKLPSREGLSLHLKPNPKLLHQLRGWSCNADIRIVAFKLTAGADEERRIKAVTGLFNGAGANAVVHNDLADMRGGRHPYTVYTSPADSWECADSAELALRLETLVEKMQ